MREVLLLLASVCTQINFFLPLVCRQFNLQASAAKPKRVEGKFSFPTG